jgi:hypothetical protein
MNASTDTFLTTIDRASRRLAPVNTVITFLADHLLPQATARAACPPSGAIICAVFCQEDMFCCGGIQAQQAKMVDYVPAGSSCACFSCHQQCFGGCSTACGGCS